MDIWGKKRNCARKWEEERILGRYLFPKVPIVSGIQDKYPNIYLRLHLSSTAHCWACAGSTKGQGQCSCLVSVLILLPLSLSFPASQLVPTAGFPTCRLNLIICLQAILLSQEVLGCPCPPLIPRNSYWNSYLVPHNEHETLKMWQSHPCHFPDLCYVLGSQVLVIPPYLLPFSA